MVHVFVWWVGWSGLVRVGYGVMVRSAHLHSGYWWWVYVVVYVGWVLVVSDGRGT